MWREYSRGNDDPDEKFYETGKVEAELAADAAQNKIVLKYKATETTNSMLRWDDHDNNNNTAPILVNETSTPNPPAGTKPEFEIYQPFLFLQPQEVAVGTVVPNNAAGVNLGYNNGELSAEIEVGAWPANAGLVIGNAVIQMRMRQVLDNNNVWQWMYTDPGYVPPGQQTRLVYGPVRQFIGWDVDFVNVDGVITPRSGSLKVVENFVAGVDTPLRIIDTSARAGHVFKVGYPAHPGVERTPDNPNTPVDERVDPANPIPDWNTKVKAKDKP